MSEEDTRKSKTVGEMKKRRVKMEDGRRYLIYYSFEVVEPADEKSEESETTKNE